MIRRTNYTFLLLNADIRWWCNKRMFGLLYKIHLIFSHLLSHILHLVWLGFNKNPFFAFVILYVFKWNEVIDYIYYPHSKNECIIIFQIVRLSFQISGSIAKKDICTYFFVMENWIYKLKWLIWSFKLTVKHVWKIMFILNCPLSIKSGFLLMIWFFTLLNWKGFIFYLQIFCNNSYKINDINVLFDSVSFSLVLPCNIKKWYKDDVKSLN